MFFNLDSAQASSPILGCQLGESTEGRACQEIGGTYDLTQNPPCLVSRLRVAGSFAERNRLDPNVSIASLGTTQAEAFSFKKYVPTSANLPGFNGFSGEVLSNTRGAEPFMRLDRALADDSDQTAKDVTGWATLGSFIVSGRQQGNYERAASAIVTDTDGQWTSSATPARMMFFLNPQGSTLLDWSDPSFELNDRFARVRNELLIGQTKRDNAQTWDTAANGSLFSARIGRDDTNGGYVQLRAPNNTESVYLSGREGAIYSQRLVPFGEVAPVAADEGKLLRLDSEGRYRWGRPTVRYFPIASVVYLNPKCGQTPSNAKTDGNVVSVTSLLDERWDYCSLADQRYDSGGTAEGGGRCYVEQQNRTEQPGKWQVVAQSWFQACTSCGAVCMRF
jgi:hypothetical protein